MEDNNNRRAGMIGTVIFHAVLLAILIFFGFPAIVPDEEEGILVMVGDVMASTGTQVPQDPEPAPAPKPVEETTTPPPTPVKPVKAPEVKEKVLTQDNEESLALAAAEKKKKEEKLKAQKAEEQKKAQEAERIRKEEEIKKAKEAEAARIAEEKRQKEAAIKNKVANAFQGSSQKGQNGNTNSGTGAQGNPFGNSATGANSGSPGYGSYDLGGRGIRGGLPKPSFSVNESGVVVVSITVNEDGKVINATIGKGTTTSSAALRNSAIAAAKKALFEVKSDVPSQLGTITYRFDSDN
ncbi:MAG: TonB family protein [Bacteroidales bacterium]|nr:TonB family protein [Bacteroidales bacterium]